MPNPNSRDLSCSLASKTSAIERATAGTGEYGTRELATPLVSTSQPAGSLQQVMSPTLRLGQGLWRHNTAAIPTGGMVFNQVQRQHWRMAKQVEWALNLWLREGHFGGIDQTGVCADPEGMPQVSTANAGGDGGQLVAQITGNVAPGGSPRLEASTGMLGTATGIANHS